MKKNLLLGAFITTALVGASFAEAPSPAFNGFYAGIGINYMNEKAKFRTTFTPNGHQAIDGPSGTASFKGGGVKLFGGYGTIISQGIYLGGELTLGFDRLIGDKKSISDEEGLELSDFRSNKKVNYGIAARIGYAISSVLPYVKFGYEGRPSLNGEKRGMSLSAKRSGFILGGGVDVAVSKCVFIRGEYIHGFGAKTKNPANVTINGVAGVGDVNFKTSSDTFLIGAAYKF